MLLLSSLGLIALGLFVAKKIYDGWQAASIARLVKSIDAEDKKPSNPST